MLVSNMSICQSFAFSATVACLTLYSLCKCVRICCSYSHTVLPSAWPLPTSQIVRVFLLKFSSSSSASAVCWIPATRTSCSLDFFLRLYYSPLLSYHPLLWACPKFSPGAVFTFPPSCTFFK